jgi:hypothetical protein
LGKTNGTLKARSVSCTPVMRAVQVTTLDVCEREKLSSLQKRQTLLEERREVKGWRFLCVERRRVRLGIGLRTRENHYYS